VDFDRAQFADLIERLDHVAIAVADVRHSLPLVEALGARYFAGTDQVAEGFRWVQFTLEDGSKLELIARLNERSFVKVFLD
jgi:hypothetical protein